MLGTFIDSFETIIREDFEYRDEDGKILFIFRKNVIPEGLAKIAWDTFKKVAQKKNDNRGLAAGLLANGNAKTVDKYGVTRGNISRSNIVGYYDKPIIQDKKKFPGKSVCRLTAFNAKNSELDKLMTSFCGEINIAFFKSRVHTFFAEIGGLRRELRFFTENNTSSGLEGFVI